MITPDKLPTEVIELLPAGVSEWARLALFILAEQHRGQVYLVTPLSCRSCQEAAHRFKMTRTWILPCCIQGLVRLEN